MHKIVLLRHGQSVWNKEPKRFTGWTDVEISPKGLAEAEKAGLDLKKAGFVFDLAFSSMLKRAMQTLDIALQKMDHKPIPIDYSWRLNERHYGALQGLTHDEITAKYGAEQVLIWRRSYAIRPPLVELTDDRYPGNDQKYGDIPKPLLPRGESLEDTIARVLPHWENAIAPAVRAGKSVIIAASGNSLRALVKHIDKVSDEEIMKIEIRTGTPLIYELDPTTLSGLNHYYLE